MNNSFLKTKSLMPLFLFAWSLYVFYPFYFSPSGISADGVTYVHIAKNIVLDGSPGWQATWATPFFSVLMAALFPVVGNFAVAGMLVSKIMIALLPLAVYLLAKDLFNSRVAMIAAILTAFHPHFTSISGSVEPEAAYTTLLVFSLWAIWKAAAIKQFQGLYWAVLAGILASLAYQTRSEGLLIFIFALAALTMVMVACVRQFRSPEVQKLHLTIIAVVFILTSLPYLLFLKGTYGKTVLSPKSAYVQIWMKSRIYHDNNLGEQRNPELWGLSKNGKLMWQEPKGVGDLVGYLMSHPQKSWQVYANNLKMQIPGRIPNNSGQWLYPQVYPWYFVIPAFFWIAISFGREEDRGKTIFLISPFLILLILPIFTEGWWKYLLPYSPFVIILAVAGIYHLCERFQWRHLLPVFTVVIAVYSIWTVKASSLVKTDMSVKIRHSVAEEQKKAGEWAQKRFKGVPNYMAMWSKLPYYLDGRWTAMPITDYYGTVWYAKKNKVDFIVLEGAGKRERERIVRDIRNNAPDLEVEDIYESSTSEYWVVFLRFKR